MPLNTNDNNIFVLERDADDKASCQMELRKDYAKGKAGMSTEQCVVVIDKRNLFTFK